MWNIEQTYTPIATTLKPLTGEVNYIYLFITNAMFCLRTMGPGIHLDATWPFHPPKHSRRPRAPPPGNCTPWWQWLPQQEHECCKHHINCSETARPTWRELSVSTRPPNSPDLNLIEFLWDLPEQVPFIRAPLETHRTERILHQCLGDRHPQRSCVYALTEKMKHCSFLSWQGDGVSLAEAQHYFWCPLQELLSPLQSWY